MRVGLIGYPVAHSASPRMHNAAFEALGLTGWRYELWATPPDGLAERLAALRADPEVAGANVTVPHKQAVLPFLDGATAQARAIGAVNTIFREGGRWWGDNTDCAGFMADLAAHKVLPGPGSRVLVLGAGGSARAVCYGLLMAGAAVRIVNRDQARAVGLAASLAGPGRDITALEQFSVDAVSLIVNCTSAGMSPNDATTPWPEGVAFPAGVALYDLVYKPAMTRLMRDAASEGAQVIGGIGMLAEQGAEAFARWTGRDAREASVIMRRALGAQPV